MNEGDIKERNDIGEDGRGDRVLEDMVFTGSYG